MCRGNRERPEVSESGSPSRPGLSSRSVTEKRVLSGSQAAPATAPPRGRRWRWRLLRRLPRAPGTRSALWPLGSFRTRPLTATATRPVVRRSKWLLGPGFESQRLQKSAFCYGYARAGSPERGKCDSRGWARCRSLCSQWHRPLTDGLCPSWVTDNRPRTTSRLAWCKSWMEAFPEPPVCRSDLRL